MTERSRAVIDFAGQAAPVLREVLELIRQRNPIGHRRILEDLAAGGRLRVVLDVPEGGKAPVLRVRLISALGRNSWVWRAAMLPGPAARVAA